MEVTKFSTAFQSHRDPVDPWTIHFTEYNERRTVWAEPTFTPNQNGTAFNGNIWPIATALLFVCIVAVMIAAS